MSRHKQHLDSYLKSRKAGTLTRGTANNRTASTHSTNNTAECTASTGAEGGAKFQTKRTASLGKSRRNLYSLPDELILKIFQNLSPSSLLICSQVCSKWSGLSREGSLWHSFLPCFPKEVRASLTFQETKVENFDWMMEIKRRCIYARNKKALMMMKKVAAYTGLPADTTACLRFLGVVWRLCLTDTSGKEHWVSADEVSYFASSLSIRWYSLQLPALPKLNSLKIYAFVPLFYHRNWKPHVKSASTRSLVINCDLQSTETKLRSDKSLGVSDMITSHVTCQGLMMACWTASWKDGGELAFVTLNLHHHNILNRVLRGCRHSIYSPPPHKPILDDVDPRYGLHGYSATVELRNHKATYWGLQYRELLNVGMSSNCAVLGGYGRQHGSFSKRLSLPWKTELFKNVLKDVCVLDITLLDERNAPMWCVSSPVQVVLNKTPEVDYTMQGETYFIEHRDEIGTFRLDLLWVPEEGQTLIVNVEFRIFTSFINSWFGTRY